MKLETYCVAEQIYKELDSCRMTLAYIKEREKENRDLQCYVETMFSTNKILTFPKEIVPEVLGIMKRYYEKREKELEQQFEKL